MSPSSQTSQRGHNNNDYGSIVVINDSLHDDADSELSGSVSREHAQGFLKLFMIVGTAVLFLTMVLVYHGYDGHTVEDMPFSQLLESSSSPSLKHSSSSKNHRDGGPDKERWFEKQLVDHFDGKDNDGNKKPAYWEHRYYDKKDYFGGPGHPIFLVLGGEGAATRLFYPFVNDHLARQFKAYVLQPEHRFYGKSQPIKVKHNNDYVGLLTPEQAMADFLRLLKHRQAELGCSSDRSSKDYCPVITVGGSYPGFLSAMMRFVHSDVIDIGYASSAPLHLYAQDRDSRVYYDKVTETAASYHPRCPDAILATQMEIVAALDDPNVSFKDVAEKMGVCVHKIPAYITTKEMFTQETMMILGDNNADINMDYYPPGEDTSLAKECHIFLDDNTDAFEKMKAFFDLINEEEGATCFDYHSQMPAGTNATVSTSDWSYAGPGMAGLAWTFQLCSDLIVRTGFSAESMFVEREWTLEWLTDHCQSRFGITPQPYRLVDKWGFDDLVGNGASRILFTNGMRDGWSVLSIVDDLSDSLLALNFPNGAHHSDLSHDGPSDKDTPDIQRGFTQIADILGTWLDEIKNEVSS